MKSFAIVLAALVALAAARPNGDPSCPSTSGSGSGSGSGSSGGSGSGGSGSSGSGSGGSGKGSALCTSLLYSQVQCCSTDVLGVADLDCANPSAQPKDASNFQSLCAAAGQRARCCTIPVAGQAVLCNTPVGVTARV